LINPTDRFNEIDLGTDGAVIVADPDFYVATMNMTGK
jgi:hypothetical protein